MAFIYYSFCLSIRNLELAIVYKFHQWRLPHPKSVKKKPVRSLGHNKGCLLEVVNKAEQSFDLHA